MDLNGKVAIVTRAGSGIGHAIAERLRPNPPVAAGALAPRHTSTYYVDGGVVRYAPPL